MARYFFHVRYKPGPDGLACDPDGDEIAEPAQVRDHALSMARDLVARTRIASIPDWFACAFEVTDEQGLRVMTVPFSDVVPAEDGEADDEPDDL